MTSNDDCFKSVHHEEHEGMKRDLGELSSSPTTGLLEINFNVERLMEGLRRFVL